MLEYVRGKGVVHWKKCGTFTQNCQIISGGQKISSKRDASDAERGRSEAIRLPTRISTGYLADSPKLDRYVPKSQLGTCK